MRIYKGVAEMQAACREVRRSGKRLGLVPTMGALHAGHLSLVRAARASCDMVAATIFVNPLQFGPNEDLARYPRSWEKDVAALEAEKVDLLFAPSPEEMYPAGAATYVIVEGLSEKLDGKSRPGHFRGVTTVVAKLFEIVRPEVGFFGQKDAAQVAVIRKMVNDLNMDIRIQVCPIVREHDSLAMSSRNAYLDPKQRKQALILHRALMRIQFEVDRGESLSSLLIETGKGVIAEEPEVRLDYLEIVDRDTLDPVPNISKGALVAVAAYIGTTRLIDNIVVVSHTSRVPGPEL
jgi:pantoate--beta-alanine ligase